MLTAIVAVVAALAGIFLGFTLRNKSAVEEKSRIDATSRQLQEDLFATREALQRSQAECSARAAFEPLAAERLTQMEQLRAELQRLTDRHATEIETLRKDLREKTDSESEKTATISRLETRISESERNLQEKLDLLEKSKQALANHFEALAGKILEEKTKSFSEGSKEQLGNLLQPLREQIGDFRRKVEEAQSDSKTGVTKLETLIGSLSTLNQQLSEEARNLSTALRGSNKAQGDWGEFILRDLLEKAGLREGEGYSFQQSFPSIEVDGEKIKSPRTDVIVSMPGGRHLVIDSKVSLNAWTDAVNAESDGDRQSALSEHIRSVRRHISTLSRAGYHDLPGIESPDFVILFIPIEPAFLAALQGDAQLWSDAYREGILLVGPPTLLYVIRIVSVLWQQELQARSVQDVMERGAELYDKFVNFVSDLETVGKNLRSADQSYSDAMKKLSEGRGNLVRQVEMLKGLGVRTKKSLPQKLLDAAGAEDMELTADAEEQD